MDYHTAVSLEEDCNPRAMFVLGEMLLEGKVCKKDVPKGISLIKNSALLDNLDALNKLGELYNRGKIVPLDRYLAFLFFDKAAQQKHEGALVNAGDCLCDGYVVRVNFVEARKYYLLAAQQHNIAAMHKLADMYYFGKEYYGRGVQRNYTKAEFWLSRIHGLGHESNYEYLGNIYYYGRGVREDRQEAAKWYELAIKHKQITRKKESDEVLSLDYLG